MLRIIELEIEEALSADTRVAEVAWVEMPAIEQELMFFGHIDSQITRTEKFESYNDYPKEASTNACRAVKWAEENGWGDCLQSEGKIRANQLCNRENITEETIARMSAFRRHQQHKDVPYEEGCGGIAWDAWGGDSGVDWAERKLKQIRGEEFEEGVPHYTKDGVLYEGPTHKHGGRLMTGSVHTDDSEYLYHEGEMAELEDACWEGYEPIGTKIKDGREVPNCVPIEQSKEEFVYPNPGESEGDFISRCVEYVMGEGKSQDEALGKCYGMWKQEFAVGDRVSFDWDDTLTDPRSKKLVEQERRRGSIIYIISARGTTSNDMVKYGSEYDIPGTRIFATGSNKRKVEKIKELGIKRHYDNNPQVVNELGKPLGIQFDYIVNLPSYENTSGDTMLTEPILMSEDCGCSLTEKFGVIGYHEGKPVFSSCSTQHDEFNGYDEYSDEEKEAWNLLQDLKVSHPEKFERVVGDLRGATEDEVKRRNHKTKTTYFRYDRILDGSPDRDFCTSIEGRYFRRMEIDLLRPLNTEFGHNREPYSKWLYLGGPNCVHGWMRVFVQGNNIAEQGPVEGLPGTPMKSRPLQGYYSEETKRKSEVAYIISQENMSQQKFATNDEKRMIYTPLMIPNILIPRMDETTKERYFVKFTPESIERIAQKFLIELRNRETNYEHTEKKFQDVVMVESWIVTGDKDKAYELGFTKEQIPVGTWFAGYKVLDTPEGDEVWKYIKSGKVKGASVEGDFLLKFSRQKNDEYLLEQVINILKEIK